MILRSTVGTAPRRPSRANATIALMFGLAAISVPAFAHPSVDIVASNWKFTPAKVTAHVGEATTLTLTSSAGVHGIVSEQLGIPETVISPGKTAEVTFTPKQAGTYQVPCSVVCGPGHDDMRLTIQIEP
jgi:cytochrome c oxidase subunit II